MSVFLTLKELNSKYPLADYGEVYHAWERLARRLRRKGTLRHDLDWRPSLSTQGIALEYRERRILECIVEQSERNGFCPSIFPLPPFLVYVCIVFPRIMCENPIGC
jgi:hypothetical protein